MIAANDDDWTEYDDAALWCARRGHKGCEGEPLPAMLSKATLDKINADPEAFEQRVRDTAYGLAMEGIGPAD